MNKLIRNGNDFLLGIVLLTLSVFLLVSPYVIRGADATGAGGGFFARADIYIMMLACILLILSLILVLRSINFKKHDDIKPIDIKIKKESMLSAIALVIYVFLLPIIGFIPISFFLTVFLVLIYMRKEKETTDDIFKDKQVLFRSVTIAAVYSAVLVVVLYFVFTKFLGSVLP